MKIIRASRIIEWGILSFIVLVSFLLTFSASRQESAIMDELAHIPAGYGYLRYFDYRLNPEHPPLVKVLAAFPLLFGGFNFPTESRAWQKDINGQWEAGNLFIYKSQNDADKIINWSRIGPIIITLLFVIFIYIWSRELLGRWWALLPPLLFAFSPSVLSHGHYVTTDVGAAFGIFIATYYLTGHLLKPTRKNLVYAGLAFGIAQLMKFSAVLLIPFFIFLVIIYYLWKSRREIRELSIFTKLGNLFKLLFSALFTLALVFIIGYLLVYIFYFVFTINYPMEKQTTDTQFILTSFRGGPDPGLARPDPALETCKLTSDIPLSRRARCLAEINILMTRSRILRPLAEYMLGVLMVLQRSAGGNTAYFLGEVSAAGWWYYFPVVFVLKESIPSLILIGIALILAVSNIVKKVKVQSAGWRTKFKVFGDYLGTNFAEFAMISFVVLYWAYSINSPLNIGVRHILPTIPFIYILTTGALKKWTSQKFIIKESLWKTVIQMASGFLTLSFKGVLIIVLLGWYLTETIFAYPNFISYFNEFGGGIENGYKYVTDSNYDWGQDLKRLTEFVDENHISKIAVDYFGGGDPKYYMDDKVEYWWSAKGNPRDENIHWLAVSINSLQGAKGKLHPGQKRDSKDEYSWLEKPYEPYARAGKSIFIYKLSYEATQKMPITHE